MEFCRVPFAQAERICAEEHGSLGLRPEHASELLTGLLKQTLFLGPSPRDSGLAGVGQGLGIWISNISSVGAETAL